MAKRPANGREQNAQDDRSSNSCRARLRRGRLIPHHGNPVLETQQAAAIGSLLCGGAAAANIVLTDYPGGSRKVLSYKAHGHVDAGIAGVTAAVPRLLRFDDEPEARFFEVEALAETVIVGLTDFDYYQHPSPRRFLLRKKEKDLPTDAAAH